MSYSKTRPGSLPLAPGRIAALAIGVPVALWLIGITSLSLVAGLGQASYPVNHSFPVRDGQVNAQVDGNITVRQARPGTGRAELRGTAHYSLVRSAVTENGDTVHYRCRFLTGNCSLDGTLRVPEQVAVSVTTAGGDLSVEDFTGSVKLRTGGGNVNVGSMRGSLQVYTGGGDVNVRAASTTGLLRVMTGGGNITGQALGAPAATVQTGGGDVSLGYATPPASLRITAGGGNVTLVLPHDATAYRIVASSDGGTTRIGSSVHQDSSARNTIYVHTGGGDISITEAS